MSGRAVIDWVGRHRAMFAAAMLGVLAVSLGLVWARRPEPPRIIFQPPTPAAAVAPPTPKPAVSPQVPSMLVVHLSGEVIAPGVYRLPVGARIEDALRAGGGATNDGDVHRLNLAARVADGQQIVVPRRSLPVVAGSPVPAAVAGGRININTATVAELDSLPGVGPVTAQRIVAYREQHGPFTAIEKLREAKLVNQPTFEKIKELVTY